MSLWKVPLRRPFAFLALGALAAAVYVAGLAIDAYPLRLASKAVPVLCLAAWVRAGSRDRFAYFVTGGLVLSALGDLLLELAPGFFLHGLAAFLLANLAYLAAFVSEVQQPALLRLVPFAAWVVAAFGALRPGLGSLAAPVLAYMTAIVAMMWRAAARIGSSPRGEASAWAATSGAVLFAASDTLIAFDRFHAALPGVRIPIILLYWAGQLGIAVSARPRGGVW